MTGCAITASEVLRVSRVELDSRGAHCLSVGILELSGGSVDFECLAVGLRGPIHGRLRFIARCNATQSTLLQVLARIGIYGRLRHYSRGGELNHAAQTGLGRA